MNEQGLLDGSSPRSFPSFNRAKHNVLCSELKQLYVAITRTRQRFWICENMEEFSKPMFEYWKKKCLIEVRELDDSLAQAMQVASTPEEWKSRGYKVWFLFFLYHVPSKLDFLAYYVDIIYLLELSCMKILLFLFMSGSFYVRVTMRWQQCVLKRQQTSMGRNWQRQLD